ncbi:hypothetical protein, partial [Magnetovibrio blakemorei]|uniref:hypothetical protein n=1 Tax=Magnetovibrio blakemorei TaxID=28181 RepID=UPI001B8BC74A
SRFSVSAFSQRRHPFFLRHSQCFVQFPSHNNVPSFPTQFIFIVHNFIVPIMALYHLLARSHLHNDYLSLQIITKAS